MSTICRPWVLISSGVVKGKRITGYIAIKDDINSTGGTYVGQDLVEDSNIISSPHYNQTHLLKRTCQLLQGKLSKSPGALSLKYSHPKLVIFGVYL